MEYQVLARKYRPQRFSDVAGQEHVTRTLTNALTQGRVAHGYIFSGHRGIGKTTIARILAQALNCRTAIGSPERPDAEPCGVCDSCVEIRQGNAVDVIEIDAATNRGIDEIRELRDAARYSPARDKYKVYILDEAHQITDAAFNALLKTLEEPPAHVVFMMATTEPENIPQTIRSRCQHFSFHAVKFDDILNQLRLIAQNEKVNAEDDALALLAEAGDGSMRDALSIMDQAIASAPAESGQPVLAASQIRELMGSVPNAVFERLLESVSEASSVAVMEQIHVLLNAGHSPQALTRQMVRYTRNALMAKLGGEQTELLQISSDERARAARTAILFSEEELTRALNVLLRTFDELNYRQEQRFHLELGLMKLVHAQKLLPLEELLSRITGGEAQVGASKPSSASGRPVSAAPQRPVAPVAAPAPKPPAANSISPFSSSPFGSSKTPGPVAVAAPAPVSTPAPTAPRPEPVSVRASSPVGGSDMEGTLARAVAESSPVPVPVSVLAPAPIAVAEPEPVAAVKPYPESRPEPVSTEPKVAAQPVVSQPIAVAGEANLDALRDAVTDALDAAGQKSAAILLGDGRWSMENGQLRIEVASRKTMLALTFNAQCEKIARQAIVQAGGPAKFTVVPGEGLTAGAAGPAKPRIAAGSIQAEALEHPLVKRAQELFQAEVRSVVDLREK